MTTVEFYSPFSTYSSKDLRSASRLLRAIYINLLGKWERNKCRYRKTARQDSCGTDSI